MFMFVLKLTVLCTFIIRLLVVYTCCMNIYVLKFSTSMLNNYREQQIQELVHISNVRTSLDYGIIHVRDI